MLASSCLIVYFIRFSYSQLRSILFWGHVIWRTDVPLYNLQIVECRRVLKWTYAYGYYLPEHEHAKRQFFEYVQGIYSSVYLVLGLSSVDLSLLLLLICMQHFICTGEAEAGLERLHQCAEKELQTFLNGTGPSKDFNDFRTKLAGLTR